MSFQTFFPTLVYHAALSSGARSSASSGVAASARLRKELHRESLTIREVDHEGREWSNENYSQGFTSYGSWDQLHRSSPTFGELEKMIDRHVAKFARRQKWDLRGGGLQMSSCWVNVMPAGAAHSLHLHPLSVVSGTFYLAVPKGSSPIKFEDPRLDRFMAQPPRSPNAPQAMQPFVTLQPREGDLILFESWLRHEVPPLKSGVRGERISVSFNYDWI